MANRNPNLNALKTNYLFPEINARKAKMLASHPGVKLISLGIGDTTSPLTPYITHKLEEAARGLGTKEKYCGYGPEQGYKDLREKIALKIYKNKISANDIFISDGAKCDIGRLQTLFGSDIKVAIQDPAYPVYIDGSIISGVKEMMMMPCTPENNFFPNLNKIKDADLIYFCSPNNPTGAASTILELQNLVDFATRNQSIIIYDAAYAHYIQDEKLPKSIYEIEGAEEVAIEVNSFSKIAGFTGVRLGWTVVPENLKYSDGQPVKPDWNRIMSTIFNGASVISQHGGSAVLDEMGLKEIDILKSYYMKNTSILRSSLTNLNCDIYGGENAPYLWVKFNLGNSWDTFQYFLETLHLVVTPGSGFGPAGDGYVRLAAFGDRNNILEAADRLKNAKLLKK